MGDDLHVLEILLFGGIALILFLRLRSVLGRRTGTEQRRDPFTPSPPVNGREPKVVTLPARARPIDTDVPPAPADRLTRVKSADPSFDERTFLTGARSAFEIIVNAFAAGDTAALKPLLSGEVFGHFAAAIHDRQAAGETLDTKLLTIKATEIAEADVIGGKLSVTVRFFSGQVNVVRGTDGGVRDGDPNEVVEKTDLWTFERPARSRDPNWILVATHSA